MSEARRSIVLNWLRLVALCPLVAIGLPVVDALLLGVALAMTLLVTDLCMRGLQRWVVAPQKLIVVALVAAIAAGAFDLLLHAFCYSHAQTLQPFLPLLIVVPILFYGADAGEKNLSIGMGSAALLRGSAFLLALVFSATLHALLPAEAGIAASLGASGLLLAIIERATPQTVSSEASASTPRTRARVTGPLR